ncbi:heme lyase CcmF/NrfE family subunit [Aquicella lusitana]|uniref:Cytochrome c-type biogenesis protein CcmF n=1 Tax=Aquicella lusitana TaxID=254246 RepID=A0A370G8P4_9COXI|nr:heme lyase CcmF/NrfE family subunit [Aquicella lusitana]RDI40178.1 cytochrome c-type biogenesis protein CcmF [Aquicella lusitana]VVC72431.1 Cytochrome c-type biogenesis protein CcmF [Aquicella lusitana]
MISLLGTLSLILALVFSLLQSLFPLWGYWRRNPYALACARPGAWGQFVFVAVAYILLTIAFTTSDFSIAYVAANSHPLLPLMYRLTAVWGAHEGSILLWILILTIWTLFFSATQKNNDTSPLVLAVLGLISFCFLCFLLLTSNPFLPAIGPQTGQDLNPLLQDPGFVIHPPMLYIGYVGFSVAFAITQAALIRGKLDTNWANITRRFALAAWCFLTFGITLGSWWAYRVLGWGGFWFWDPVENASLLPWLSGTALIHVLALVEKRNAAKAWAALLAIISFALSLLGTFLVRSGVLISAHTFANDPARGIFLLLLLAVLMTSALAIYVIRLPAFSSGNMQRFTFFSRETMLLLNSLLLFTAMLTVLLGTLYPLILDALHLGTISVGAPYFNKVMTPLTFIVMLLMGFGPFSRWQDPEMKMTWGPALKRMGTSILAAGVLLWFFTGGLEITALITLSLSFWIMLSLVGYLRFLPGMSITHLGFAILVIGVILSNVLNEEREARIKPGDAVNVGPYQFFFVGTESANGANYRGVRAEFEVLKKGRPITALYPEKRIFLVRDMVMTKVDIHPSIFRDLYIALGEPLDMEYWSVRIYYKPFVRFIWVGGLLMIVGGFFAMRQRKQTLSAAGKG